MYCLPLALSLSLTHDHTDTQTRTYSTCVHLHTLIHEHTCTRARTCIQGHTRRYIHARSRMGLCCAVAPLQLGRASWSHRACMALQGSSNGTSCADQLSRFMQLSQAGLLPAFDDRLAEFVLLYILLVFSLCVLISHQNEKGKRTVAKYETRPAHTQMINYQMWFSLTVCKRDTGSRFQQINGTDAEKKD